MCRFSEKLRTQAREGSLWAFCGFCNGSGLPEPWCQPSYQCLHTPINFLVASRTPIPIHHCVTGPSLKLPCLLSVGRLWLYSPRQNDAYGLCLHTITSGRRGDPLSRDKEHYASTGPRAPQAGPLRLDGHGSGFSLAPPFLLCYY